MMVTFVSQCEKKALNKTRRVLDAFANRIGDNTWQTVITNDGLIAVKKLLRRTASKSTAVSCHWIRSRSRSELVWVVGNKNRFSAEGVVPVNSTMVSQQAIESFALNTKVIALLANMAGLFHDVGKATALFQDKLQPSFKGSSYEPYRHEWVSLRIFQAFVNNQSDIDWLNELVNIDNQAESKMLSNLVPLRDGIVENPSNPIKNLPPVAKLVAWLIVSHHKLPQYPKKESNPPTLENIEAWLNHSFEACWNSPQCLKEDWLQTTLNRNWQFPEGTPLTSALWQTQASEVAKKVLRIERMHMQSWFDQHYTAHLSRLALMLSDHYYSSLKETCPEWQDRNYHAFANTDRDESGNKYLKQKLDEHNIAVGINAYQIARGLPKLRGELPALKPNKAFTDKVPKESQENFGWQDHAYTLAKSLREDVKKHGFFGVCQASTGKGKTRGNARIIYGLSDDGGCRFSVALGLRTLTLQTGDALKKDLKLKSDELSLLIGSQAVKDLHQQTRTPDLSEQQNNGSESSGALLKGELTLVENLPEYTGICAEWFKHDLKILKLIQSPILVSTIDYLMPANEGVRGGRQIAPMLRLLTSDLVLDEPDDFGLEDLPALCRLVNWAGMLGSRVLLSTATISPSLASALFTAYQAGRKQYTQVNGKHGETVQVCCAWFDEFKKPQSSTIDDVASYEKRHIDFVERRITNLTKKTSPLRRAKLVRLERDSDKKPSALMASVIRQSVETLHQQHSYLVSKKNVSIGLVRMANIDRLVQVSKAIMSMSAPTDTVIHYCIYHSQFPLLQRSKIERQLDAALSRNDEKAWLDQSGIPDTIKIYEEKHHIFLVLATAVAEVGRDHDYDWAVIEPSSYRSIIQLAGRVQRHRQQQPASDNIHILSKNYKGLTGQIPCFVKPGFESAGLAYASPDLNDLVGENEFAEINAIARIKMPTTTMACLTQDAPPRFKSFSLLEHYAQMLRLVGNTKEHNHASQWWQQEATWCGELQSLQPFRQSLENDEFCLMFNPRTQKTSWQIKVDKTFPVIYETTSDIAPQPQPLKLGHGNVFWGQFDLQQEIAKQAKRLTESEEVVMRKFTHLSLRKLNENSDEQWQCHPMLGVYNIPKKDEY
jgi:CRISPR-associated endonuclease/helicase Cas3